jgi:cytochrome P450
MLDERYAWYREMRAAGPVHRHPDGYWAVFTYSAVRAVLADPATFSSDPSSLGDVPGITRPVLGGMLSSDPPRHDRLRTLAVPAFAPVATERMRQHTEEVVTELLDAVIERGSMDIIADLAYPLPATGIARMLGIPAADRDRFLAWTEMVLDTQVSGVGGPAPAEVLARREQLVAEMDGYFAEAITRRRTHPGDDVISTLVAAETTGQPLTSDELLDFCRLLLFAGHATTMNLIGNAAISLEEWPDARERLRRDPPAVPRVMRYARRSVELGGHTVAAGDRVVPFLASANRDQARFEHADGLDIDRHPNPHVAFGHGIHFCIGAPLARLEAAVAVREMLRRLDSLRCELDGVEAVHGVTLHGVRSLPARFRPGARALGNTADPSRA